MPSTTNKSLAKVVKGQLNADETLNLWADALDETVGRVSQTTGINAGATGDTVLYTVPTGKRLVLTDAVIRVTAASAITVGPSVSIGGNSTSFNDHMADAATTLTAAGDAYFHRASGKKVTYAAGTVVKLKVNTAATGTSITLAVDLLGYLLPA